MAFTTTKYEADNDDVHPIRLNTKTTAVAGNAAPAGATTSSIYAKISKSNREFGLRPRYVVGTREVTATVGDETFVIKRRVRLPILTQAIFDGATFDIGATFTYDGETYTVTTKESEDY